MKIYTEKDRKRRLLFLKFELIRSVLKYIIKNKYLTKLLREKASVDLSKLPKNSARTRIRNRCVLTGRSRFVFSSFNMSRLTFRKMALSGFIPGLRKASW